MPDTERPTEPDDGFEVVDGKLRTKGVIPMIPPPSVCESCGATIVHDGSPVEHRAGCWRPF